MRARAALVCAVLAIVAGMAIAGVKIARADGGGACIYNAIVAPIAGYPTLPACDSHRTLKVNVTDVFGTGTNANALSNDTVSSTGISLDTSGFCYVYNQGSTGWDRCRAAADVGQVGIMAQARNTQGATAPIACDQSIAMDLAASTALTQEIAGIGGKSLYVCAINLSASAASTAVIEGGTGTNCATATSSMTASLQVGASSPIVQGTGVGTLFRLPVGDALCISTGTGSAVHGFVEYAQF